MSMGIEPHKSEDDGSDQTQKSSCASTAELTSTSISGEDANYPIRGPRVAMILIGTCLALFIVQSEASVASTAVVAITDDLGGFDRSAWIFTAYFLTYSGTPIILSRLSDMYGRKPVFTTCILLFTVMSGACGAAQSLTQLIMFRWVQGLGAGGILAIGTMYGYELRPKDKRAVYSAIIFFAATVSYSIAPVIGALLTDSGHWRWIFLYCVPIGTTSFVLLLIAMRSKLPIEPAARKADRSIPGHGGLSKLDFIGALALLGGSVLMAVALQEAAFGIPFSSQKVLIPLVIAPCCWLFFLAWEWSLTHHQAIFRPLISWNVISSRIFLGLILNSALFGAIQAVVLVQVPQRFMTVYHASDISAGLRLMPVTVFMASASALASILTSKVSVPAVYWLLLGAAFEIAGTIGLSMGKMSPPIEVTQYVFEALVGVGTGLVQCLVVTLPIYIVERKDHAVTMGAVNQFRLLGSSLALSITACASNSTLRSRLMELLSPEQADDLLDRTDLISELPPNVQTMVRTVFGHAYNLQMTIMVGFAVAMVPASLIMWQRKTFTFGS